MLSEMNVPLTLNRRKLLAAQTARVAGTRHNEINLDAELTVLLVRKTTKKKRIIYKIFKFSSSLNFLCKSKLNTRRLNLHFDI